MCRAYHFFQATHVLRTAIVAVSLGVVSAPCTARATTIHVTFKRITNNNVEDLSGQLSLAIHDKAMAESFFPALALQSDEVLFAFSNNVGIASSITEIYVDDDANALTLLSISSIANSLGGFTNFHNNSLAPPNLPSGNTIAPPFVAIEDLSVDTASGPPANGVNTADDILGIVYQVSGGILGVLDAIEAGDLRIGMHVRSIGAAGGSDAYVNIPPSDVGEKPPGGAASVPEPSSLFLCLLGFVAAALICRRVRYAASNSVA